jgi:pyruvate/2-oxoglutarate dehydrogenase complex dihydrolipoamide dehydrogenase (E3) component
VLRWPFHDNDRAQAEGRSEGLVKVIVGPRGKIIGAGIVGPQAGEIIHPWVQAISQGLKIGAMVAPVAPYPTRAEANRRAAITYYSDYASNPWVRRVIRLVSALRP